MTEDNSHKGWKLLPGNSVPQAVLFCFPFLSRITLSLTSVRKVKPGSEFLTEEQDDGLTGVLVALCSHYPLTITHILLINMCSLHTSVSSVPLMHSAPCRWWLVSRTLICLSGLFYRPTVSFCSGNNNRNCHTPCTSCVLHNYSSSI